MLRRYHRPMPERRRFPPPWTLEEHNDACFIVKDANGQALRYFYFPTAPISWRFRRALAESERLRRSPEPLSEPTIRRTFS